MIEPGDMPTQSQLRALLASITPGDLHDLLRQSNERYAYEEEFARRSGDLDLEARSAAWEILDFCRRVTAYDIGSIGLDPRWFIPTPDILRRLHDIDVLASGHLVTALEQLGDEQHRFTAHALMDEAIAACLAPDEQTQVKDVRSFLRHGLEPRTRTERLVVNFYLTMQHVPKIAANPLTLETVFDLQRMLSAGLTDSEKACDYRHRNIPRRTTVDRWPGAYLPPLAHEVPDRMRRLMEDVEVERTWVHPLIYGPLLYFSLLNVRPFELSEVGLSRAVFQVYMHRAGYPALQLMPISQVLLHGYRDYGRSWPAENRGDLTGFVTWSLENMWTALDRLSKQIDARVAENDRLREQLRFDPTLNHRQRTILGRAIRIPGATFFIEYHRRSYGIAYSTARADLMGLVDRGYMRVRREGHAFVFGGVPGLRDQVMTRSRTRTPGT